METASASSQSLTGSGRGSSQFPWKEVGEGPGVDELEDELMFDLDVDLEANDRARLGLGALRRSSCRPRFLPCQAGAGAYIREVDDSIDDTVRTYVFHLLRTYVILFCNWLIL